MEYGSYGIDEMDLRRQNAAKMARRRFEARELLDRLKSAPCEDCRRSFHPCQMDLLRKQGGRPLPLSRMMHLSKERLLEEAGVCDLVCANCSRLRSWRRQRERRMGPT